MSLTITWEQVSANRNPDGGDLIDSTTTEIVIDAVVDSDLVIGGVQTKRPIEAGALASDHWRRNLGNVNVRCAHTNTPPNSSADIELSDFSLPGGRKASMGRLVDGGTVSRIQALQDAMRALIHDGHLVTITGLSRVLTDWRILSMSTPRTSGQAGLVVFTLVIEEVIRSTIDVVDAPAPRIERARPATDDGGNNGQEAEAPTAPQTRQSFAAALRDGAGQALAGTGLGSRANQ